MRSVHYSGRRLLTGWAAGVLAAVLVAGCGVNQTGLQRDAARQLQARVLEVTEASSHNDPTAALKALEGLETELAAAQERGDVSEERRRNITTIATAVRADLEDALAAAELAAAKAAEEQAAAKAAEEQAAATATSSPAPEVPAPQVTQPRQGNSGPGQDNDAGKKDEEKGKGKD